MRWLISIPLAMMLVSPSCQRYHFQTGTIDITNSGGARTLHANFHGGEVGKLGRGMIFRATLDDGSTMMIESTEAAQPEEQKK